MDYQKLIIRGISYSQNQSGAYALLLEHESSKIKLPIVIGGFEAQAITLGLEKDLKPMRPLTHDLFSNFVRLANYVLDSIVIYQILEGVFFSNLIFKDKITQEEVVLDARTSDAVAMAVRFNAPIYTTKEVLEEAGILLLDEDIASTQNQSNEEENDESSDDDAFESFFTGDSLIFLSDEELENLLKHAVEDEDFDAALEIQEVIKRRKEDKEE